MVHLSAPPRQQDPDPVDKVRHEAFVDTPRHDGFGDLDLPTVCENVLRFRVLENC